MSQQATAAPITVQTDQTTLNELDALAATTHRSRDDLINHAIRSYLDTSDWQLERIDAGLADLSAGRVHPAEEVFAELAAKYGWKL